MNRQLWYHPRVLVDEQIDEWLSARVSARCNTRVEKYRLRDGRPFLSQWCRRCEPHDTFACDNVELNVIELLLWARWAMLWLGFFPCCCCCFVYWIHKGHHYCQACLSIFLKMKKTHSKKNVNERTGRRFKATTLYTCGELKWCRWVHRKEARYKQQQHQQRKNFISFFLSINKLIFTIHSRRRRHHNTHRRAHVHARHILFNTCWHRQHVVPGGRRELEGRLHTRARFYDDKGLRQQRADGDWCSSSSSGMTPSSGLVKAAILSPVVDVDVMQRCHRSSSLRER